MEIFFFVYKKANLYFIFIFDVGLNKAHIKNTAY